MAEKEWIAYFISIANKREFRLYWLYETFFNRQGNTKIYN